MNINLETGLIYWLVPAGLAITALILLLWWIILLVAPPPRSQADTPRRQPSPPPVNHAENRSERSPKRPAPVQAPIDPDYHTQLETNASLVVLAGLSGVGKIPLPGNQVSIGRFRDDNANIVIAFDELSVSRQHAQVRYDVAQRSCYLTDTNSTYGTYLVENGKPRQLTPGREERIFNHDIIQFGQAVQVRFMVPGDERGASTVV